MCSLCDRCLDCARLFHGVRIGRLVGRDTAHVYDPAVQWYWEVGELPKFLADHFPIHFAVLAESEDVLGGGLRCEEANELKHAVTTRLSSPQCIRQARIQHDYQADLVV